MWCSPVRFFVALTLILTPLALEAQPGGQVRRIGFLALGSRAIISTSPRFEAFKQALRERGWVEGAEPRHGVTLCGRQSRASP
jgi:hypothetical protein